MCTECVIFPLSPSKVIVSFVGAHNQIFGTRNFFSDGIAFTLSISFFLCFDSSQQALVSSFVSLVRLISSTLAIVLFVSNLNNLLQFSFRFTLHDNIISCVSIFFISNFKAVPLIVQQISFPLICQISFEIEPKYCFIWERCEIRQGKQRDRKIHLILYLIRKILKQRVFLREIFSIEKKEINFKRC